jgi:RHS repeat-associated protein
MMIYTANQTAEDLDVYMDDLTILHTEGPIIRVDDYYPFGLTYHTSERTGYTTNNFLYNGKELQTDLDLDWYDYGARMYDASIGRFNRIDRFSNMYYGLSPYNYGANNPILFVDVNGDSLHITGTAEETIALLAARADACGCKLNVTGSTNDDGTLSYSITGFESTDDDFAEIQNDLQDIIDSPEIITEIIVKTDPSKLDKVEEMGGSYYDPESNTIIHADSWLSGEWSNIPAPSYRYAVDKAANSGDKLAFWIMDFFVEPENNPYSARKRRLIPFSEAIAHESQHAAEDVRGKLLPKDKQYSGYRSDVEHNAINTVNKMRERKGIPLRKTR